jgi:hypothetical protein
MLGNALRITALVPRPVYATSKLTVRIALSRYDVVVRTSYRLSITRPSGYSALRVSSCYQPGVI